MRDILTPCTKHACDLIILQVLELRDESGAVMNDFFAGFKNNNKPGGGRGGELTYISAMLPHKSEVWSVCPTGSGHCVWNSTAARLHVPGTIPSLHLTAAESS